MKKKNMLVTACLVSLAFYGCVKHSVSDSCEYGLKVGHVYCADGYVIEPDAYVKSGRNNAVGVVFWVADGDSLEDRAYVISLEDLEETFWCDSMISTGVSTSIYAYDGAYNTSILQTFKINSGCSVPAMEECVSYSCNGSGGWVLPSAAQLAVAQRNRKKIEYGLQQCGGTPFNSGWYWSSTEDNSSNESKKYNACIVSLINSSTQAAGKLEKNGVRPMKVIK